MDRLACVDVPVLPLQLLLRRHDDWSALSVAVVDRDTPQGLITHLNESARKGGIRTGMRYADALSLEPALRAGTVSEADVEQGVDAVVERLRRFSPTIEPSAELPGVLWLDASGLELLYATLEDWAHAVAADLRKIGFRSTMAVGFTRFGTFAAARSRPRTGAIVFDHAGAEQDMARRVPLDRIGLDPKVRELLAKLGIHTVGTFLRLPAAGLLQRFGAQAHRLHRMASGDLWTPLVPRPSEEPVEDKTILDEPVLDVLVLLAIIKRSLAPMLERLAKEHKAVSSLHLLFALDTRENLIESVRAAKPTLDMKILVDLVQLRLHTSRLPAGVREIDVRAETVEASREQLALFAASNKRDLAAAARALARVRAELGEDAVVRAQLREGHLPEGSFTWERWPGTIELPRAHPRKVAVRTLVRRLYARAVPLPARPASERNDNWLMQGLAYGPVVRMSGPFVVSGGWWNATIHREYHFIETGRGDILWVYYDRRRRRWYLQGTVE